MIGLALESTEPDQAIKILNQIAAIYVRQNVERTSAEAAQSLAFLKEQLPEVKKDLEKAGKALNEYQTRSKSVDITLETKAILDQIVGLDTSISELKLQQAEMDRKFTRQHPAYRALLTQIGELTVVRRNDGSAPLACGAAVGLDWESNLLRVLAADEVRA